jgi:hypothetical protein
MKKPKEVTETVNFNGRWYMVRGCPCKRQDDEPDGEILCHMYKNSLIPGEPPEEKPRRKVRKARGEV